MTDAFGKQLHRRVTQISGERLRPLHLVGGSSTNKPGGSVPKTQQKRPLPISENKLSFDPKKIPEETSKRNKRDGGLIATQPQHTYSEFLQLDQAGPATIASDNSKNCSLVAIKTLKLQDRNTKLLHTVIGDNVVGLLDFYRKGEGEVSMVYEHMDVSLRLVNSIARGKWNVYEIAALCKEVVNGLSFVHNDLHLCHGSLDCSTILLDRSGRAKLANIGESMLEERRYDDQLSRKDIQSVGNVMMELMEESTSVLDPGSIELKDPHVWQPDLIKQFLAATQSSTLAELRQHDFLAGECISLILKPYVFTALICAKTEWAILSS